VTSLCNGHGVCRVQHGREAIAVLLLQRLPGRVLRRGGARAPTITTEGIMLIIILIALTTVIGLVVFMFMKLRKLTVDPGAYDQLQGRCK